MAVAVIPKPLYAPYPDGGVEVDQFELRGCDRITAHEGGILRVWRGFLPLMNWKGERPEVTLPYYPIEAVGMTEGEINRAVNVAKQMLSMPQQNRKARRKAATRH